MGKCKHQKRGEWSSKSASLANSERQHEKIRKYNVFNILFIFLMFGAKQIFTR